MTTQNANLALLAARARPEVVGAIRQASTQTGVDFAYLLEQAAAESSFDPQAQASTSSARGLYQFVERTWLDTMDRHGAAHGYPNIAAAIMRDANGNPVVANAAAQEYILELRENPRISALMAAELAQDNRQTLQAALGREVSKAELHMAHFLGAGGAAKFLDTLASNGAVEADYIVPAAARVNAAVFYENGVALSVEQVFAHFEDKFSASPADSPVAASATRFSARTQTAGQAAILAAFDPRLAALNLLQSLERPDEDRPHEWVI